MLTLYKDKNGYDEIIFWEISSSMENKKYRLTLKYTLKINYKINLLKYANTFVITIVIC